VPATGHHHHFIVNNGYCDKIRIADGGEPDEDVDAAVLQLIAQRRGRAHRDLDGEIRALSQGQVAEFGQKMVRRDRAAGQSDVVGPACGKLADLAHDLAGALAQHLRALAQHISHRRQADSSAGALEKRAANGRLHAVNALGQGRLTARQLFRCPPTALCLRWRTSC